MSSQEPKVNSYLEFKEEVLPRIRKLGYNAIQIMAIQVSGGMCSGMRSTPAKLLAA